MHKSLPGKSFIDVDLRLLGGDWQVNLFVGGCQDHLPEFHAISRDLDTLARARRSYGTATRS